MSSPFDEYFAKVTLVQRAEFERIRQIVHAAVPSVVEGISYGMPAYLYRGKGLLSAMATKKHLSLYPFSGKTIDSLRDKLAGYELTSGSIHFLEGHPLSESLIQEIIRTRVQEIDARDSK